MRFRLALSVCVICLLLTGCAPVIRGPGDELRLYSWSGEWENGNTASLTFDEGSAAFEVNNDAYKLSIGGLCSMTDESFVILNEADGVGYTFSYTLHGDCVELFYKDGSLTLDKE